MCCRDAVQDERGNEGLGRDGCFGESVFRFLGEIAWGFARRSFVYNVVLLLLCGTRWPPGKNRTEPRGGFHREEGAPALLFLMVASEHSASDVSQSESPNCSGFCEKKRRVK